jgi:hypothetical protein
MAAQSWQFLKLVISINNENVFHVKKVEEWGLMPTSNNHKESINVWDWILGGFALSSILNTTINTIRIS